jgi:RNA polymerase primary sigma factor
MRPFKPTKKIIGKREMTLSVQKFLEEASRTELITPEKEHELVLLAKNGDEKAKNELISAHSLFLFSVAKKFEGFGTPIGDLINEGSIALGKSLKKFDPTRGFRLLSYAVWGIQRAMLTSKTKSKNIVRLPENKISLQIKVNGLKEKMEETFGINEANISPEILAEILGVSKSTIKDLFSNPSIVSLTTPISSRQNLESLTTYDQYPEDLIADEKTADFKLDLKSLDIDISRSLGTITRQEEEILLLYFGIKLESFIGRNEKFDYFIKKNFPNSIPLEEIGEIYDLTRERARQIKEKAIRRLKFTVRSKILKKYLG